MCHVSPASCDLFETAPISLDLESRDKRIFYRYQHVARVGEECHARSNVDKCDYCCDPVHQPIFVVEFVLFASEPTLHPDRVVVVGDYTYRVHKTKDRESPPHAMPYSNSKEHGCDRNRNAEVRMGRSQSPYQKRRERCENNVAGVLRQCDMPTIPEVLDTLR